ncbi:hypothetical protein [Rathayibacter oskolensis]|uniref:hypothetical protein n=1 Tax=Rathayibacter oskolensis TaxID=1891671 RepID=UPI003465BFC9
MRESAEEAGVPPRLVLPVLSSVVTIGPWSYTHRRRLGRRALRAADHGRREQRAALGRPGRGRRAAAAPGLRRVLGGPARARLRDARARRRCCERGRLAP